MQCLPTHIVVVFFTEFRCQVESVPLLYLRVSEGCSSIKFSHLHFPAPSLLYGHTTFERRESWTFLWIIIIVIVITIITNFYFCILLLKFRALITHTDKYYIIEVIYFVNLISNLGLIYQPGEECYVFFRPGEAEVILFWPWLRKLSDPIGFNLNLVAIAYFLSSER